MWPFRKAKTDEELLKLCKITRKEVPARTITFVDCDWSVLSFKELDRLRLLIVEEADNAEI